MSGHTPGPWRIEDGEARIVAPDDRHSTGYARIADASSWWVGNDRAKANARLIAAAPDLLEACIAIADVFGIPADGCEDNPHAIQVRDAIAKATGSQVSA